MLSIPRTVVERYLPNFVEVHGSIMNTIFTSPSYWFKVLLRSAVKDGNKSLLGEYWIVGLGTGFKVFREFGSMGFNNVTGTGRWVEIYTGSYGDASVSLIAVMGGTSYAEAIVALAWLRKVKAILGLGLCGALREDLDVGDIVMPIASVREDGLTDHYVDRGYPAIANPYLVYRVYRVPVDNGLKPRLGLAVSRSSTFTEGKEWVESMTKRNVLCVDVETSVLYTLTYLLGIPACASLVVSDNLVKGIEAFRTHRIYEIEKKIVELYLEAIKLIEREGLST